MYASRNISTICKWKRAEAEISNGIPRYCFRSSQGISCVKKAKHFMADFLMNHESRTFLHGHWDVCSHDVGLSGSMRATVPWWRTVIVPCRLGRNQVQNLRAEAHSGRRESRNHLENMISHEVSPQLIHFLRKHLPQKMLIYVHIKRPKIEIPLASDTIEYFSSREESEVPWKSMRRQRKRMVLWMIHARDFLLLLGKALGISWVHCTYNILYTCCVQQIPYMQPGFVPH